MSARPSIFDLSPTTIHPLRGQNCHAPTQEWNAGQRPRVGGARSSYTYDPTAGRTHLRLSKTDPQGMTTNYGYDTVGNQLNPINLTRRGDTNGTPASLETDVYSDFVHDSLGRQTRGPDANWYPADSAFDALDRPVKSPDGRGHQWDTVYDANGNPLMVGLTINGSYLDGHYAAWDDLDRLERRVDYAGNAVLNSYNPLGRLTSVTGPDS